MSGSDRSDGQTGNPRDVFSMPREYLFSCMSESTKEKRRERDAFTRRLSSSISVDAGGAGGGGGPPPKRRAAGGGSSSEAVYSGRPSGVSCNGWHDDVISRSKSFGETGTHGGNSAGRVTPRSPRFEFGSADGSSPKEVDGYRFYKPGSPLFVQSRISSLAQASHHSYSGKGVLAREHSRCSEWDYPDKADMDYRDKIWGRSELHKRTGSGYEAATASTVLKDSEGRREQEGYVVSADSTGVSSHHIRSYQEWRQGDRIATSALPLRTHVSTNGYLKESGTRAQGFSDVLESWHSPLSSPVNYPANGGRDDGSQTSPRKRPRLGWGQGLAKYEKKIIGGAEDILGTKVRGTSCSEEISSCMESPHGQAVSSARAVSDSAGNLSGDVDKDVPKMQMEQKSEAPVVENVNEKNKELGSMAASMIDGLDGCQSLDASMESKDYESTETLLWVQSQLMVPGQSCSEHDSGKLKASILQRLEKLELELDLTEKELAKIEDQPGGHQLSGNDNVIESGNSVVVEVQFAAQPIEQKDGGGEVLHASKMGDIENAVSDDQRERPVSGIGETSSGEVADALKGDSMLLVSSVAQCPSFDSLHPAAVIDKDDKRLVKAIVDKSQGNSLKERSLSATSFSAMGRMTGDTQCKEISLDSLIKNGQTHLGSFYGTLSKIDINRCWNDLYTQNMEQAKQASQALDILLPAGGFEANGNSVGKSREMAAQEESMESKEQLNQRLQNMLLKKKISVRFRELVLALKFRALRETWKHEQAGLCHWTDRTDILKRLDAERNNGILVPTQRTSHRLRLSVSGNIKVDAVSDELHTMQKLLVEPFGGYQRPHLKMPSQILDERERKIQRFITNNGLIEDPVAFEQERKTINPWTPEEKSVFVEKFFLYTKHFQKIATFLEHKTVADCIEFYYRYQKSEEFEKVRRRQQLKNRRDYSRPLPYLVNTTPPNGRRREIAANCVGKLPIPSAISSYNEDGRAFCSNLSKNVKSNHVGSVDSNCIENPPGNSGVVTGRNITTEQSNKVKAVQSSQSPTSIIDEFDSQWTDHERKLFVSALGMFGKDFRNISQHVATKSEGQCKAFFSKTRKRLGLDQVLESFEMSLHEGLEQAEGRADELNSGASVEQAKHVDNDQVSTDVKDYLNIGASVEHAKLVDIHQIPINVKDDHSNGSSVDHKKHMEIVQIPTDVKADLNMEKSVEQAKHLEIDQIPTDSKADHNIGASVEYANHVEIDQIQTDFKADLNVGASVEHAKHVDIDRIPSDAKDDLNIESSKEHAEHVEHIEQTPVDVKDVNGAPVCECLPLDSVAGVETVSADSREEPVITDRRTTGDDQEIQDIEDERSVASNLELKDSFPKDKQEEVPSNDIEEQTESTEENVPVTSTEILFEPKEEKTDNAVMLMDVVSEASAEVEHVNNTVVQQDIHTSELLSNAIQLKSGGENETHVSASVADVYERPSVEETDLQADSVNQVIQEFSDVTPISHSSSNQTSPVPVVSNVSTVTSTSQPRARGNSNGGESKPRREATSWTQDEKEKFVEIIRKHGRDWSLLQENLPAKSLTQIKTYFQNSKAKLGFTTAEGTQSRSAANRKPKMDESDSVSTLHRPAHHKAVLLSEESVLKCDQSVNGGGGTVLCIPGSECLSFSFLGKGTWQAEDTTAFNGKQKVFQQTCPTGYTNGLFSVPQSSALSVSIGSGFHQPQNLSVQQSLTYSTSSKTQSVNPQQNQQIAGLPQLQTSSSCDLQSQILNQSKQQQKANQVISRSQQDYGIQQFQKWIMQQQAVQSFQQNLSASVLQQQQLPQHQVILQQQNQQQHLSQSSHQIQHALSQNLHYLQQKTSVQSLGQLAALASQQLSSNHPKILNQHQLPSQQQLMNPLQLHYDDQQQYHLLQSNQVSQQEHLALQLHHHQKQSQPEKQQQPLRTNLPIHMYESSEVFHHQQGQTADIPSEKEQRQWQELHNCQSLMLQKGTIQSNNMDASTLRDSIELKNILMSQTHETVHLQESQVNVEVLGHPQLKPVAVSESHQTRAGDVKLFGQFLLSQPASSSNLTASSSESGFPKPMLSFSSSLVSPAVASSISEGLPYAFSDGPPCLPSGFGRIGLSISQGQCHHLSRQSTSAGTTVLRNNLLDGREHACLTQAADSESDTQNNAAVISRLCEANECDNTHSEGASSLLKFMGEQSKRLQDGQNPVMGFGIKKQGDQSNSIVLSTEDLTTNSDLKSGVLCMSSATDLSSMMGRNRDLDWSQLVAMFGVSTSQDIPDAVERHESILASARRPSSREIRQVGGHSNEEHRQSKDLHGSGACHAVNISKTVIPNTQPPALAQSFVGGIETLQVTRDSSYLGPQGILHSSGNVGLDVSMWSSGTSAGHVSDLQRITVPVVSSGWPHGSVIVEGQPRPKDSKDAEDNKRQTT